ncbi:MAG: FUSC family protein [Micropruina sp.]|uniref:FUSC family protein n=1 Tax=Micropruina sp. TaxID=2737536 RepID=UPI0039E3C6A9
MTDGERNPGERNLSDGEQDPVDATRDEIDPGPDESASEPDETDDDARNRISDLAANVGQLAENVTHRAAENVTHLAENVTHLAENVTHRAAENVTHLAENVTHLAENVTHLAEDAWNRLDFRRWMVLAELGLRQGLRRMRGSLVPILTAGIAAWIAFLIAHEVLGHPTPFFAPIASWICLGFTYNRVPRKVLEIGGGVALGVAIGELILANLGAGGWQLALGLPVAALIARVLDRGDLFTIQAGVNAMVVVGMGTVLSQMTGAGPSRLVDAVIGSGVALLFTLLFPGDIVYRPRRYVANLLSELATAYTMLGEGLRQGNRERLRDAHAQLRGIQGMVEDTRTVWQSSSDIIGISPTMRRHRPQVDELGRQLELGTRAVHTTELLLRQSRGVVDERGSLPIIAGLMDDTAAALHAMSGSVRHWNTPQRARKLAIELAAKCAPGAAGITDWRRDVLLSVMRSVAIDLLQMTGLSRIEARVHLPDTEREVGNPDAAVAGDEGSAIWGAKKFPI